MRGLLTLTERVAHPTIMSLRGLVIASLFISAACRAEPMSVSPPEPSIQSEEASTVEANGWLVSVSVEPAMIGRIRFSVEDLRLVQSDPRGWVQHDLAIENTGYRGARFDDLGNSIFLNKSGRPRLLVADEGCGWGVLNNRLEPGICELELRRFVVPPYRSVSREVTVAKGLKGMSDVLEGTYVFPKPIRFRVGDKTWSETLRITYEVQTTD